jgi:hypothetical protein
MKVKNTITNEEGARRAVPSSIWLGGGGVNSKISFGGPPQKNVSGKSPKKFSKH